MSLGGGERVPAEVADVDVLGPGGAKVRVGSLWATEPCLVILLRHFGCVGCAEQLDELVPRLGEIRRAGVGVALIGNGSAAQRDAFVEERRLGQVTVLTDPDRVAYTMLSLRRSRWATNGPRAIVDTVRAMAAGHPHRSVQGDATQQGGVLLVDPTGTVRFFHASRSLGDHPPTSDLVAAVLRLAVQRSKVHV